jgi:putative redox protein
MKTRIKTISSLQKYTLFMKMKTKCLTFDPMETSRIIYTGELRAEATHVRSGQKIISDAPVDNHGKGEAFSPTDLLATSLGGCMVLTMGIACQTHNLNIDGTQLRITKVMAANPRRVAEVHVEFDMPKNNYTDEQKSLLENTALTCPVAKSLHPDVIQKVTFNY